MPPLDTLSEGLEVVEDGGGEGLDVGEHRVEPEGDEHEEEDEGPELRPAHLRDGLGEDDEGQTGTEQKSLLGLQAISQNRNLAKCKSVCN